ncbi:hypothetical protein HY389_02400 [Candidatus Daviesbacteria bacterium]|nr:hypothetical protein [Candidatus Daviesbacteria bacterium]
MLFSSKNPKYEHLRKKWVGKHREVSQNFLEKHGDTVRRLTLGGVGSMMLLATPATTLVTSHQLAGSGGSITSAEDKNQLLAKALAGQVPDEVRPLTPQEEQTIAQTLTSQLGIVVKPELDGVRLNRSYGLIGGEQHLYRYPGDTLYSHATSAADWAMYGDAGIAPGLGAWGYFAPSQQQFTPKDAQRERYYIAVQTFLAPGFAENVAKYRDFFRYRKMIVVNPKTGQAVVTDVGDAGPADWTGKHLGGSPEVMQEVGLAQGPRKGAVIYMFIDDPNDQIPLGPVTIRNTQLAQK